MSRVEIEIQVKGERHKGSYVVDKGTITVTSMTIGSKSDSTTNSDNGLRAEQLLEELVNTSNGHGWKR